MKPQLHKIGTLFGDDFYVESTEQDAADAAREYFRSNKEETEEVAARILLRYYKWCEQNGIAKHSVVTFAKEIGLLIE
jgi:vacuolar-type H+-ATPase subunit H